MNNAQNNPLKQRIQQMTTTQICGCLDQMNKKPSKSWSSEEILIEDQMLFVLLERGFEKLFIKYNDMV